MPISILMPALSPTMEEGTLAKWHVKEGDVVSSGDVLAEIETDKATMEIEAIDEGTVAKLLIADGTEAVLVNTAIAIILEDGEDASALEGFDVNAESAPVEVEAAVAPAATPTAKEKPNTQSSAGSRIFSSPLARRIASQEGVDIASLAGTGPRGRVVKKDVEAALAGGISKAPETLQAMPLGQQPAVDPRAYFEDGSYDEVPLDKMRMTIARRLTQSKQEIPHYYISVDCELDALLQARKDLNAQADEGIKISVNDFVVRAAALALKKVPDVNVSYAGNAVLKHHHADIGIAVAIDGGLITPIIAKADEKGLAAISTAAKDLALRARERKLKPFEFEGGGFSISNLGMFGVKNFTAVINPPQSAILAVGAGEPRPVIKDGQVTAATVMTVTLSCDHRVIDGALGAQFLQVFKRHIELPASMLM
ncbi:MAG: pyruvate dehydrogenase complex dihydrolipoamide acetyltransferase [Parvibaculaceae bacterium]|nr:pyruvate dehydrogenase complex dihydrolipoamide acetyltransferase [Parvibaculaceae bacterium]